MSGVDPTFEGDQSPPTLFGVALPQTTGAPGSQGAGGAADPTNEPGQLNEGISGLGPADIANTGAPGSQGVGLGAGGSAVSYTRPGSWLSGTYETGTVQGAVSGSGDWTQASPGLYSSANPMPGVGAAGDQLADGGAGQGRVLRGGRAVHP